MRVDEAWHRPLALIARKSAPASTAIGLADLRSMMLPLTSTLEGAHRAALLLGIDSGGLHHDAGVMMGCVGDRRTAAYNYCLAD